MPVAADNRERSMQVARPDRNRHGSEKGQREHAGPTSEKSDAGMKSDSQGIATDPRAEEAGPIDAGMDRNAGDPTGEATEADKRGRR
jgi:hypothetical protein